ncbi:MAG TPA: PLP-dependent aminotransferase family protein [Acidobacteriaceae bacterium]|nr:PLP-dependent aminotransferase family protein [Acidobacteriaceae bacterium]
MSVPGFHHLLTVDEEVVGGNIHLTGFQHDHYTFAEMKKVASGIFPLIAIDRKSPKALHRQIYDAYRAAVVDGILRPGQRIPSTRELAAGLGVSRFPVLNAYAQLLAEGYFESRVGAGTVISSALPERFALSASSGERVAISRSGPRPIARRTSILSRYEMPSRVQGHGAFGVGLIAFDHFPLELWSKLVSRQCREMGAKSLDYGERMGSKPLRKEIASYLRTSRSVRCELEQVMIVSGSQQALEISGRVLLDPGSPVWVEDPGYRFARDALTLSGCRLVPVPVDREGLNVAAGMQRCRKARAAVVTPSHQFPLGVTMSAMRRLELLDWAKNMGAWIIEDDYDSEFRYASSPITSLQGLDANARVVYIGTFSKVLFPSLRLGYVVVPPDLVDHFVKIRRAMDLGAPTFNQEVLAEFIAEGHFARHIRRMRVLYNERRTALAESIGKELGSMVEILGDEAGLQLTLALPDGIRDREIAERAAKENLSLWPLSASYLGDVTRPGFILGFGNLTATQAPPAVRKLANLLTSQKNL